MKYRISAKVIKDSISPKGVRLTTFELSYPRYIHAEVMTHRQFCLGANNKLIFDLPSGTNNGKYTFRSYSMTLGEFAEKWINGAPKHKSSRFVDYDLKILEDTKVYSAKEVANLLKTNPSNIRRACRKKEISSHKKSPEGDWFFTGAAYKNYRALMGSRRFSLKNKLMNMKIRQINERTGAIQHSKVLDCFYTGEKEVFKVKADKFSVEGSKDHLVLTEDGWVRIEDIIIGKTKVICQKFGERVEKDHLKKIDGKWRNTWQNKIRGHLIAEQDSKCAYCSKNDVKLEVHHEIPVHQDQSLVFDLSNVKAICYECHKDSHKRQGWQKGKYLYSEGVLVESVESVGIQSTYDLTIDGEFPNFLANGVVVHNSRNAQSSRAVPVTKTLDVNKNFIRPLVWGKNKAGMSSEEVLTGLRLKLSQNIWNAAAKMAFTASKLLGKLGLHKQWSNRLTEPFSSIKVIVTSTEWENFMWLRLDKDAAQPEIVALAEAIQSAHNMSIPLMLKENQWHIPYIQSSFSTDGTQHFYDSNGEEIDVYTALEISSSCCAQVSYRNLNETRQKALDIYQRLFSGPKPHLSPTEHQACVMKEERLEKGQAPNFSAGVTALRHDGWYLSGNFRGWVQHRQVLEFTSKNLENHFSKLTV